MADDLPRIDQRLTALEALVGDDAKVREGLKELTRLLGETSIVDQPREALQLFERALALARRVQSPAAEAWFTSYRGFARYLLSDHESALADFKRGETLMRELGDEAGLARMFSVMAGAYISLGDYEQALETSRESLRLARRVGDRFSEAWNHHGLAIGYQELGDIDLAREHFERALEVFIEVDHASGHGRALTGLATVNRLREDYAQAESYLNEALAIFRREGIKLGEARALSDLGILHHRRGRHDDARRCHEEALRLRQQVGNKQSQATSLIELGRLAIDEDRVEDALERLEQALQIATEINSKPRVYQAHEALADAYSLSERFDLALAHLQAYQRVKEEVLGEQATTRLRNQQVRFAVERSEREAEINRLKNIELRDKNEQLERLLRQLQETQAQLVQSEKLASLGQLIAGLVHELSNPLGALTSAVNVAQRTVKRAADQLVAGDRDGLIASRTALDRNLGIMNDAAMRLASLIENLKTFVQLDQSAVQLADLNRGLRATLEVVRHELGPEVRIETDLAELPRVRCRPGEINQVFLHLLSNAARAVGTRGTITVTTRAEGDEVAVTVADDGPGIPAEQLARLFEPEFSRSGERVKAGLGLFLSHGIVRRHGGRIDVASEPGRGSVFTVHLPLVMTASA